MRINSDVAELKAFCEVMASGSFTKAADLLALSPSALSRRIGRLEEALGGRLLERTTRVVTPTPLGRNLYARLAPGLAGLSACLEETAREARGEGGCLAVGCVTTFAYAGFPRVLARFREAFPDLRVDLRDDTGVRVLDAVRLREVTFGVTVMGEDDPALHAVCVRDDPYVLACTPDHPLAGLPHMTWADLRAHRVLGLRRTSANRLQIDAVLAQHGIGVPWHDEVEHLSSMIGFLQQGSWIGVLPSLALQASRNLVAIPLEAPRIARRLCLVRRNDTALSFPAARLWEAIAREAAG